MDLCTLKKWGDGMSISSKRRYASLAVLAVLTITASLLATLTRAAAGIIPPGDALGFAVTDERLSDAVVYRQALLRFDPPASTEVALATADQAYQSFKALDIYEHAWQTDSTPTAFLAAMSSLTPTRDGDIVALGATPQLVWVLLFQDVEEVAIGPAPPDALSPDGSGGDAFQDGNGQPAPPELHDILVVVDAVTGKPLLLQSTGTKPEVSPGAEAVETDQAGTMSEARPTPLPTTDVS